MIDYDKFACTFGSLFVYRGGDTFTVLQNDDDDITLSMTEFANAFKILADLEFDRWLHATYRAEVFDAEIAEYIAAFRANPEQRITTLSLERIAQMARSAERHYVWSRESRDILNERYDSTEIANALVLLKAMTGIDVTL